MSHVLVKLNIIKVGQFLQNISYFVRMNDTENAEMYIERLKDYIDWVVANTKIGGKNG